MYTIDDAAVHSAAHQCPTRIILSYSGLCPMLHLLTAPSAPFSHTPTVQRYPQPTSTHIHFHFFPLFQRRLQSIAPRVAIMIQPDLAVVSAFEQACQDAQVASTRAAAELALNHLTARPDAIPIALYVAQHTTLTVARFHAAITLRIAAANQWTSLPSPQRHGTTSLRFCIVNDVISHPTWTSVERKALLRTAAFLTRRAYIEEPPHDLDRFFALLCETAANPSPSAAHAAGAACELIELLTEEFMAPSLSRSAPALQKDMLLHARSKFAQPHGHLVSLLHASIASLSVLLSPPAQLPLMSREFEFRALPALSTVFRVLATDVTQLQIGSTDDAPLDLYADANPSGSETLEAVVIHAFAKPGWWEVVEQVPTVLRICFMITGMHGVVQNGDESELIAKAAQIVTAVAAISHSSYGSVGAARELLASLLDGINEQRWSSSPMGVVRLAYAEIWRRVSCAYGLSNVERLGTSYLDVFMRDTCHELDFAAARLARPDDDEDVFSLDVADMLLETWANLALQGDDGVQTAEHPLAESIGRVVVHFTRMSFRSSGEHIAEMVASAQNGDIEEDLGFEDMSIADARMAVAAILTRFVLHKMVPAISQSLLETADKVFRWQNLSQGDTVPLDFYQEDLYFLVRFTAAVLADEAKGEHPSVPIQFLPAQQDEDTPNGHGKPTFHATVLLSALFDVAQGESNMLERLGPRCEEASPRVGTAILDALNRVARTYLVPTNVNATSASIVEAIGGNALMMSGRHGCFSKAIEGISLRGFESDVAEAAANLLLTMATSAANYTDVRESPAWHTLLLASSRAYQNLPVEAVHLVGRSLTTVLGDVVADSLLIPAYNSLRPLADVGERSADAANRAIATMNLLRGAAQCTNTGVRTRETLLLTLQVPDGTAAECALAFAGIRPDVGRALVMLARDTVSTCLSVFDEQRSHDVLRNAVGIVKLQAEIVSKLLGEIPTDELANDIEEIISLLSEILDEGADVDVAEASYYGLSTLFPIISDAALELPSIGARFLRLTVDLVCQHPSNLVMLPGDFCRRIFHTIDQRHSADSALEMRTLEAIASLARSRVLEKTEGPSSAIINSTLLAFLKSIFDGIASGSAHSTNLDAAADALLPLLHVQYDGVTSIFEDLGRALLKESGNNEEMRASIQELGQAAAQAGFIFGFNSSQGAQYTPPHGISAQRQASKVFREAVFKFSSDARKHLLTAAVNNVSYTQGYLR